MTGGYLLASLAWSIGGFVGGFAVGSLVRRSSDGDSRWQWSRTLAGLLILALVAWTSVTSYRVTACQAQRNAAFAAGLAERSEAARIEREAGRIERDAMRTAIRGTPPTATLDERRAASQRYLAALDAADRLLADADAKRAAAPAPDVAAVECW